MTMFSPRETRIQRQPVQMHHEGAIRGAEKAINDHKTGLPEFMKNAAGAYHRLAPTLARAPSREDRIIVLLFRAPRGRSMGAIGCLDLVGMTPEDTRLFQHWFDPNAASRGDPSGQLWGGHGNGAKSYMLKMFNQSWFATSRDRRFTRMGWMAGNVEIGFIPSRSEAGSVFVADCLALLDNLLQVHFAVGLQALPSHAREVLRDRPSWTCFVGIGPRNWTHPRRLLELLQHNPQAIRSIEYCSVTALVDGQLAQGGQPLVSPDIQPLPGGETPLTVAVPRLLNDPEGAQVDTTADGRYSEGRLELRTSREPMRYTLRPRHVIRCESSSRGVVGLYPVQDLAGRLADHIYGELYLDALQDYETNFRSKPHDAPLTRSVEEWLRQQIFTYANRFLQQEQDRHTDEERNELQELNVSMNRFLQQFLEEVEAEAGDIPGEDGGQLPGRGGQPLPLGEVHRIEHNLGDLVNVCGENVSLYVRLAFFDAEGTRVRPIPVHWESSDTDVADAQLGSIITGRPGNCELCAVAENGVRSIPIRLQVVHVETIQVVPYETPLPVGARRTLDYEVAAEGDTHRGMKLDWHSTNEALVKVGSNTGVVTVIGSPGMAEVYASALGVESNRVSINTTGEGAGGSAPRYPKVLLSEINDDPDTSQPKRIDPDAGTVVQDVADRRRNIFWVNMRSPLAEPFLRREGNLSFQSPEFRVYLAERYAEVVFLNALARGDQWESGDVIELLRERPTRLRQALARNFQGWLHGEWQLQ